LVEVNYTFAYIKMLLALGAIVLFLLWLKRYLLKKNYANLQKSVEIKVITQKQLDAKNKITLISYKDKEYLIVTSENGGFLIDKYENFDKILKDKKS